MKEFKPINIQLFAEPGEPAPTYDNIEGNVIDMLHEPQEVPTEPTGEVTDQPIEEPIEQPTEPTEGTTEPPIDQPIEPPQPSQNELALMQQLQQMQQAMAQQQQQFQQFLQNQMIQQQQPQPQKTPEELEAENQALIDELLQNPIGVLNRFVNQAVSPLQQEIQSYKEKEEWNNAKQYFERMTDDNGQPLHGHYGELRERVEQLLQERPGLMNPEKKLLSLKNAYDIALAEKLSQQPPQPSFMEMVKDPNNLQQLINNPDIMKAIAAAQAQTQQKTQQQVPPMATSSGVANAAPYIQNKPNTWNELEEDVRTSLKQGSL
jgi:hypothetical protein